MIKRYFNRSLIYLLLTAVLASCAGTGTSSLSMINLEVGKDESVAFFVRKKKYMASLGLVKVVMDGQEVCLICVCSALPEPEIKWLRNTHENPEEFVPVTFTNDLKSSFDSTNGKCTLKISDTYPQDAGIFICVASNIYGNAETQTNLIVECMFFLINFSNQF